MFGQNLKPFLIAVYEGNFQNNIRLVVYSGYQLAVITAIGLYFFQAVERLLRQLEQGRFGSMAILHIGRMNQRCQHIAIIYRSYHFYVVAVYDLNFAQK